MPPTSDPISARNRGLTTIRRVTVGVAVSAAAVTAGLAGLFAVTTQTATADETTSTQSSTSSSDDSGSTSSGSSSSSGTSSDSGNSRTSQAPSTGSGSSHSSTAGS